MSARLTARQNPGLQGILGTAGVCAPIPSLGEPRETRAHGAGSREDPCPRCPSQRALWGTLLGPVVFFVGPQFPSQGLNSRPLHWKHGVSPRGHQESLLTLSLTELVPQQSRDETEAGLVHG